MHLTKNMAEQIIKWFKEEIEEEELGFEFDSSPFENVSSIDDAAAEILILGNTTLGFLHMELGELKSLPDTVAKALGKLRGRLDLCSLSDLSDEAAEGLSTHEGLDQEGEGWQFSYGIDLGYDCKFSQDALKSLVKAKGKLDIPIADLNSETAEILSKHEGGLRIYVANSVLSEEVAEILARHAGPLSIRGVHHISDGAADQLSKLKFDLELLSLKDLSDDAADNLSKHVGVPYLAEESGAELNLFGDCEDGDSDLSPNCWTGTVEMSENAAESLLKHKGPIYIPGPHCLSESVFEILKKHPSLVDAEW